MTGKYIIVGMDEVCNLCAVGSSRTQNVAVSYTTDLTYGTVVAVLEPGRAYHDGLPVSAWAAVLERAKVMVNALNAAGLPVEPIERLPPPAA